MSRKATKPKSPPTPDSLAAPATSAESPATKPLPKGWRLVRFGEVVRDVNKAERNPLDAGLERFVGLEHIIRIQNLNGSREFNYFGGHAEPEWVVEPGELLFAWAGVKGVSFGPCLWDGPRGVLNQHIYRIVPSEDVEKNWLYELLRHITHRIEKKAHGFKLELVHVRKAEITDQIVAIPPIDDQRRIARFADTCRNASVRWQSRVEEHTHLKKRMLDELFRGNRHVH